MKKDLFYKRKHTIILFLNEYFFHIQIIVRALNHLTHTSGSSCDGSMVFTLCLKQVNKRLRLLDCRLTLPVYCKKADNKEKPVVGEIQTFILYLIKSSQRYSPQSNTDIW